MVAKIQGDEDLAVRDVEVDALVVVPTPERSVGATAAAARP